MGFAKKGALSFGLFMFVIFLVAVLWIFIYFGQRSVFVRLSREENKSLGGINGVKEIMEEKTRTDIIDESEEVKTGRGESEYLELVVLFAEYTRASNLLYVRVQNLGNKTLMIDGDKTIFRLMDRERGLICENRIGEITKSAGTNLPLVIEAGVKENITLDLDAGSCKGKVQEIPYLRHSFIINVLGKPTEIHYFDIRADA